MESTSEAWTAIVSLERGRLVHFGPSATGENLLFATPTPDDPLGWGGHRVWLGPQSAWAKIWPPPPAWERSATPEPMVREDGALVLPSASAGDGWATFQRDYRWQGSRLVCGVTVNRDGTKDAQVIQILQVPTTVEVRVRLQPDELAPAGFVGLPAGRRRAIDLEPKVPAAARLEGSEMVLRHTAAIDKLGFRPQPIHGRIGRFALIVGRGETTGEAVAGELDHGFLTQVYLGGPEAFVELEQLSPQWKAGTPARFEMVLEAAAPRGP
jgi:hypothetical protein